MGKRGFGYCNLADAATVTASACQSTHPITEVQVRELAPYAEFISASPEIFLDLGSALPFQVVCIFAHTVEGASDTVKVDGGTTLGGSEVYVGSALSCWPFSPLDSDRDGSHFGIFVVLPAVITARYIKITLTTSAAPRIGRIFAGRLFEDCIEYGDLADDWQAPNSTIERTESGADWPATRPELRFAPFVYSDMLHPNASLYHEIVRTHTITGEVVHIPDTEDRAVTQQYGFLATMRKLSALDYPKFARRSAAVGLDERGGAP